MQDSLLFEYAVIRVVPWIEREEFINVGVVVYCGGARFLQSEITFNKERLQAFPGEIDSEQIEKYLHGFEKVCEGGAGSGPIGALPPASRFRWLTAARSTIVQTSRVHPGLCTDPAETLFRLHRQLVL